MATAISGFRGRVIVGTTTLLASKWSVTYKTELQDCSSFEEETGGAQGAITPISRYVASLSDMEVSIDAFYDVETGIIPALKPGSSVDCELFTNKGANPAFGIAAGVGGTAKKFAFNVIIENLTTDTEVRGVIKYTISGRVSGGQTLTLA
jgi:hypothetical protein